ncbi:MAG: hypothetical protein K2W82_03700 [Candidatus Obscuribacterales bacterium]|nr:hypothetical protein [Candidatus Obscuribacterales bacterium]
MNKLLTALVLMSILQLLYPLAMWAEEIVTVKSAQIKLSSGSAIVSEIRNIELKEGNNEILFEDMHPFKILFEPLSNSNSIIFTELREVGHLFGAETIHKEQDKLDRMKTAIYGPQRIVGTYDNLALTPISTSVCGGKTNKKFRDSTTLFCTVVPKEAGNHRTEICYLNSDMSWKGNYKAVIDKDFSKIDFSGQVNIENKSDFAYKNVDLVLVGFTTSSLRSIKTQTSDYSRFTHCFSVSTPRPDDSYIENHQYKVLEKVDLPNNAVIQMRSCDALDLPFKKVFVYEPTKESNVLVKLELVDSKKANLGVLLPGIVSIYQKNKDGVPESLGKAYLEHTSVDQKIRLSLSDDSDLVGSRKQFVDGTKPFSDSKIRYICQIDLQNNKNEEVMITCIEHLDSGWKIVESNQTYNRINSHTFEFAVKIPAYSSHCLTYVTAHSEPSSRESFLLKLWNQKSTTSK